MDAVKWIPVFGYEDKYEISSSGEVRVKARDIFDRNGSFTVALEAKLLEIQTDNGTNRAYVILHDGNSYRKEYLEDLLDACFNR